MLGIAALMLFSEWLVVAISQLDVYDARHARAIGRCHRAADRGKRRLPNPDPDRDPDPHLLPARNAHSALHLPGGTQHRPRRSGREAGKGMDFLTVTSDGGCRRPADPRELANDQGRLFLALARHPGNLTRAIALCGGLTGDGLLG